MIELNKIYNEDCRETMRRMPDGFVDCVICSPPYYQLRRYEGVPDMVWGGDKNHEHDFDMEERRVRGGTTKSEFISAVIFTDIKVTDGFCGCGAWKGQLGL